MGFFVVREEGVLDGLLGGFRGGNVGGDVDYLAGEGGVCADYRSGQDYL